MLLIIKHCVYAFALWVGAFVLTKYNTLAAPFSWLAIVFIAVNARKELTNYTSFGILKGLLVFVPLVMFANNHRLPKSLQSMNFYRIILAINILLVSYSLGYKSDEFLSKVNGLNLFILALLTPKIENRHGAIGLSDRHWIVCFTTFLLNTYIFNDYYGSAASNWRWFGVYTLIIPFISVISKQEHQWLPMRIYSLCLSMLSFIVLPKMHERLSQFLNNTYEMSNSRYNNFKLVTTCINTILVCILLKKNC